MLNLVEKQVTVVRVFSVYVEIGIITYAAHMLGKLIAYGVWCIIKT